MADMQFGEAEEHGSRHAAHRARVEDSALRRPSIRASVQSQMRPLAGSRRTTDHGDAGHCSQQVMSGEH
jgi:hypothetical protein